MFIEGSCFYLKSIYDSFRTGRQSNMSCAYFGGAAGCVSSSH